MEVCGYCDARFSFKKNLYAHQRIAHNVKPDVIDQFSNTLLCALCESCHKFYSDLRDHYLCVHEKEMFKEVKLFNSLEEFMLWKEGKEKDMKCSYVKYSGTKRSLQKNKTYYACHRSGHIKDTSGSLSRRAAKSQGSAKLGYSCPSTLQLTEEDGKFEAVLFTPHIGHECSLKHLNLSTAERAQIEGKIAEGVPFSRILDDIRSAMSTEGSLERIQLLTRQDLRNIKREFLLKQDIHNQIHKSAENNESFRTKLDLIYDYVSNNTLSDEVARKMEKALDAIIKLLNSSVEAVPGTASRMSPRTIRL